VNIFFWWLDGTFLIQYYYVPVAKREILGIMNKCIAKPRETKKENGPVIGKLCV